VGEIFQEMGYRVTREPAPWIIPDEVWVVYPKINCVWVYSEGPYAVLTGTLEGKLFPGLSINLASRNIRRL